jgi:hypothetical protein
VARKGLVRRFVGGKVTDQVLKVVEPLAIRALQGGQRLSQVSLDAQPVLERYREAGQDVTRLEDVATLHVGAADELVPAIRRRYATSLAAQGAAASGLPLFGGPTAPALASATLVGDVASLVTSNLRAIGEVAFVYGFDPASADERLRALAIMNASLGGEEDEGVVDDLSALADGTATPATREALHRDLGKTLSEELTDRLSGGLVRRKIGQLIPVVGAGIGGVMNYRFTTRVVDAAASAYRAEFLRRATRQTSPPVPSES